MKILIFRGLIKANQAPKKSDEISENKLSMKQREYIELNKKIEEKNKEFNKSNKNINKAKTIKETIFLKPDDRGAEVNI